MTRKANRTQERRRAERSIVLESLADDHPKRSTRKELGDALKDIEPKVVGKALERLAADGVVVLDGGHVEASRCARKLDALGLVSI
jgi:DNA-binding HxlR family transcriptional regulator